MTLHQQDRPQSLRAGRMVPLADRVRTVKAGRAGLLMDLLHRRPDGIGLGRGDPIGASTQQVHQQPGPTGPERAHPIRKRNH